MLAIKFRPVGKPKQISYRVVVQEKKSKLKGRFIEDLGFYNPHSNQKSLKENRIEHWLSVGAQPTDTVYNLLVSLGIVKGKKRPVHSRKKGGEEAVAPVAAVPVAEATPVVGAKNEEAASE